jgi:hypothetical protein
MESQNIFWKEVLEEEELLEGCGTDGKANGRRVAPNCSI